MSEKFEVSGTVIKLFDTKIISDKFSVREFVVRIEEDTEYPQSICLQAAGKRVPLLDDVAAGDVVAISFNLRGREYTGGARHFCNLDAWKIEVVQPGERSRDGEDVPF